LCGIRELEPEKEEHPTIPDTPSAPTPLRLHNRLGEDFISEALEADKYDFVFADTWPGKYFLLDEVLRMVKPGGIYVIDDMNHSNDWPDGHGEKAQSLLAHLQGLKGWSFSYYTFGTGVGIGQRHSSQRLA